MWDIKYRPKTFAETIGQHGTVQLLKARLRNGSALDTSYIFSGAWGSGKTTLSRIFARASLCLDMNKENPEPCNACDNCLDILNERPGAFEEKDAASGGTIDIVRAMVDDIPFSVMNAQKRVWLFDEAHRMSIGAQDVLLKPLEEKKVVGIFCTTEANKIRGPIRSRCEEYTIRKATREELLARMQQVLTNEQVPFQDDAVLTVIDFSGGHVRDILNRLEMIALLGEVNLANVRDYLNLGVVSIYYNMLLSLGSPEVFSLLETACERATADEVSTGLAEAAMNSYRIANGMFADFVQVDKELAQKVYARFGAETIPMTEFFLRHKAVTKTGLVCDLLGFVKTGGAVPDARVPVSAPVVIAAPVTVAAPAPVAQVVATAPPAVMPVATPAPMPVSPVKPVQTSPNLRPDGIGPIGVDPLAYTEVDHKAVPHSHPRKRNSGEDKNPFSIAGGVVDDSSRILTADEWRREFQHTYRGI